MNKTWQLRTLAAYLAVGAPLATSCAREANTLEDLPEGNGGSSSAGASPKAGATNKAGSPNAFGGSQGKSGSGGKAMTDGGEAAAEGGEGTGGSAGSSGSGGSGGMSTGVPPDVLARASVVIHYQNDGAGANTNKIFMKLYFQNKSTDDLPLANVKVRYWFSAEATPVLSSPYHGGNIASQTQTFVLDAANSHVLVTFSGNNVPTSTNDLNAAEFQIQIEGGTYNQSNDFSWDETAKNAPTPNDNVTVYLSDKLIWGCEPSGKCFDDELGAGGATGAGGAP